MIINIFCWIPYAAECPIIAWCGHFKASLHAVNCLLRSVITTVQGKFCEKINTITNSISSIHHHASGNVYQRDKTSRQCTFSHSVFSFQTIQCAVLYIDNSLPTHVLPSRCRTKPWGHSQRKLPAVLIHWPLWQTSTTVWHSSMSTQTTHSANYHTQTSSVTASRFFLSQSTRVTDKQTDRQTDDTSMAEWHSVTRWVAVVSTWRLTGAIFGTQYILR